MTMLELAIDHAQQGYLIFPVHSVQHGACTCGGETGCTPGRHPILGLVPRGEADATTDLEIIRTWWTKVPNANVGAIMDDASGHEVYDATDLIDQSARITKDVNLALGKDFAESPNVGAAPGNDNAVDTACTSDFHTDLGNARRLVSRHETDIRFIP